MTDQRMAMSRNVPLATDASPLDEELGLIEARRGDRLAHRAVFRRMARNIGWLLGGRGFQGAASLGYLAFSARALGPEAFGAFTLILSYGQAIANLASFQSWQTVIRYGALHISQRRWDRMARMLGFTATLDLAASAAGALLAAVCVPLVGPLLGWSPAEQGPAAWFAAALLLSTGTTPAGMLRLEDRFDLLTYAEGVGPLVRLAGAFAGWLGGASIDAFLAIWAGAALAQALATWLCARMARRQPIAFGTAAFRQAVHENRKLVRFMIQTNLSASLGLLSQVGTLAVGAAAGPSTAGGFRLAGKLAKSIAKPIQLIGRVLYPELARLVAGDDRHVMLVVLRRSTWIAILLGAGMVAALAYGGDTVLRLVTGEGYGFARPFLIAFGIAGAIDISGFALEPLHHALGRAGRVLGARAIGAGLYYVLLAILLPLLGPIGAAIASILSALAARLRLALSAAQLLRPRLPGRADAA